MAAYVKFEAFVGHLAGKMHDLLGTTPGSDCDTLKIYLSNAAPSASGDAAKADLAEITPGNGYTAPVAITNSGTITGGTFTLTGVSVQIAASGGPINQFQHVVLYNDTPTTPVADPLIAYWSRATPLTLEAGETFDIKFNDVAVGSPGTIFTLA